MHNILGTKACRLTGINAFNSQTFFPPGLYVKHSLYFPSRLFLKPGSQNKETSEKLENFTKTATLCTFVPNLSIIPFAMILVQQETSESFCFRELEAGADISLCRNFTLTSRRNVAN